MLLVYLTFLVMEAHIGERKPGDGRFQTRALNILVRAPSVTHGNSVRALGGCRTHRHGYAIAELGPPRLVDKEPRLRKMAAPLFLAGDEKKARQVARQRGLPVAGTLGVLDVAAKRGLVDLADALDRLRQTNFRAPARLLRVRPTPKKS